MEPTARRLGRGVCGTIGRLMPAFLPNAEDGAVSGEIAAGLMEHCGESLLSPVVRVASADVPVPFTPVLENAYRPDPSRIVAAVRELVQD